MEPALDESLGNILLVPRLIVCVAALAWRCALFAGARSKATSPWGCSTFPKCRSAIALESTEETASGIGDPPGAAPGGGDVSQATVPGAGAEPLAVDAPPCGNERRRLRDKLAGAVIGAFKAYDKI